MNRFKNRLVAAGTLVILVGALTLSLPRTVKSAPPPSNQNVTVTNPPSSPIPTAAQGTTAISGTVGISGMPAVNLAPGTSVGINGTPTVNLGAGTTVGINSATDNPVFVRSVDGRATFQEEVTFTIPINSNNGAAQTAFVPNGKRAVIEHVTGYSQCDCFVTFRVIPIVHGSGPVFSVPYWLISHKQGDLIYIASEAIRTYSYQGPYLQALRDGAYDQEVFVSMAISGYYEDLP